MQLGIKILQGALIGLGAVLPGVSGGVLCVIFGIYKTIMEFLSAPFRYFKTHMVKLLPVFIGIGIGFLGIAKILAVLLERHPAPSVCLFVGLIGGMLPSLFREAGEQGRSKASYISLYVAMGITFVLLICLQIFTVSITPNFGWYLFCGFCMALSMIAPGMSFSTLLMPLDLYEPFVAGIGRLDFTILLPTGIGAAVTVLLLSRAINSLFEKHYSVAFHGILGIVIAATIVIVPYASFLESIASFVINLICLTVGVLVASRIDKLNQKIKIA